jgi:ABC-2 type transport system permease protein
MKIFAELLFNFNIVTYVIAVLSNIAIFAITVFVLRNIYFKINSKSKEYSTSNNKDYKIVTRKPVNSLINKEFKKFFSSSVFVTNAAFSLVVFIVGCVAVIIKYDDIINAIVEHTTEATLAAEQIKQYVPLVMGGFIIVSTFMSSITSSMISLEGKKIEILKSLPIKSYTIITSKVLMAVILMVPILLIGTLGVSIRCSFGIVETIILLALCIIMTFVAETFGIIINLKYPKMDAKNDTEVVKQSTSSMIAVMGGMFLIMINMGIIGMLAYLKLSNILVLLIITVFYVLVYALMKLYINNKGTKLFNRIQA